MLLTVFKKSTQGTATVFLVSTSMGQSYTSASSEPEEIIVFCSITAITLVKMQKLQVLSKGREDNFDPCLSPPTNIHIKMAVEC